MKTLQDLAQRALAKKGLTHASAGALLVQKYKQFLLYPDLTTGYVKHNILTIRVDTREDRPMLFAKKNEYVSILQQELEQAGFSMTLQDIRILVL